jgi:hypothetical protein
VSHARVIHARAVCRRACPLVGLQHVPQKKVR